jgi:DNA (cytosine-5)-methyltransferase 1
MKSKINRSKPIAIDLFSGCGGMTEGLKQAGFMVAGAVEIDALAAETYKLNHKGIKVWQKDIRDIGPAEILKELNLRSGEVDLLTGCPPCQGFSSMRRLNGGRHVRDARNDLLFDFLRFVRGLCPKTVMMENVPGIQEYWRWPEFRMQIMALGYKSHWKVLNAADYGVPQRRRRLIFLATKKVLAPFQEASNVRVTVKNAISHLPKPGKSGDVLHDVLTQHDDRIRNLIKRIPKNGGSRSALGNDQLRCHKKFKGFRDVYGRMSWDDVSPTITGGCTNPSKGRFLHPVQNRAITLREAALLQSFPSSYKFSLTRGKNLAALLIGNSLPPEFARRNVQPLLDYIKRSSPVRASNHLLRT